MDFWFFVALGNAILGATVCVWMADLLKKESTFIWGLLGFFFGIIPIVYLTLEVQHKFGDKK